MSNSGFISHLHVSYKGAYWYIYVSCPSMCRKAGRRKANVFPVPVWWEKWNKSCTTVPFKKKTLLTASQTAQFITYLYWSDIKNIKERKGKKRVKWVNDCMGYHKSLKLNYYQKILLFKEQRSRWRHFSYLFMDWILFSIRKTAFVYKI